MARPVSWLPRLHEIRRSVENSVRTHYDRAALEQLFKLQPRAAGKLMDMLPQVEALGRSRLVEREELSKFLGEVHAAEDVTALCIKQRAEKENVSRKKPRQLVRRDSDPGSVASLPKCVAISLGRIDIRFDTMQQLVDALWRVALACQDDWDQLARVCDPETPVPAKSVGRDEVGAMYRELEEMEAARARAS